MDAKTGDISGCPFHGDGATRTLLGRQNKDWWPEATDLGLLTEQGKSANPYGEDFDYAAAFNAIDYNALKADLTALDDGRSGMVASRLWSLRPVLHPHDLARSGHLPHRRWPRRCRQQVNSVSRH